MNPLKLTLAFLGLTLSASCLLAEEIVIYKYSSNRAWTKYECYNPDASTPTPRQKTVGTFPIAEYWIENRTDRTITKIAYYTLIINGSKQKLYQLTVSGEAFSPPNHTPQSAIIYPKLTIPGASDVAATDIIIQGEPEVLANIDLDSNGEAYDNYHASSQNFMAGPTQTLIIKKPLAFYRVAPTTTGEEVYNYISNTYAPGGASIYLRTFYKETGATTLKIDSKLTVLANTSSTPTSEANTAMQHAQQLVFTSLDRLGYENAAPIASPN